MVTIAGIASGADNAIVGGSTDLWGGINNAEFIALAQEFVTKTVAQNFADFVLSRAVLQDTAEQMQTPVFAAAQTVNYSSGHAFITMTNNMTSLTITNPPVTGKLGYLQLWLAQDGTGTRTFTPGATFKPIGNTAPFFDTTSSAVNIVDLETRNGGTSWAYSVRAGYQGI